MLKFQLYLIIYIICSYPSLKTYRNSIRERGENTHKERDKQEKSRIFTSTTGWALIIKHFPTKSSKKLFELTLFEWPQQPCIYQYELIIRT